MEEEVYFKIKSIRKKQKMTLKNMSEKTGFSVSFLSQMERGISPITMTSLKKITTALGIPMKILFTETETREEYYRSDSHEALHGLQKNYKYIRTLSGRFPERIMDSFFLVMEPHATGFEAGNHDGEEFYYIVKGCGIFIIDGCEHEICAGETIHYPSRKTHLIQNREDEALEMICVITPLIF
ncbi:helix-turn-helix domain-containing protein [Alkalibaculum sporogenes]|nr:XRE family transcriptional regulator [Alkalibaculum sporogenes]